MPEPLIIACVALIFYALVGACVASELHDSGDSWSEAIHEGVRWPLFFYSALKAPAGDE